MRSTTPPAAFAAKLREFMAAWAGDDAAYAGSDDTFNDLALELFAIQFRENAVYSKFCNARGARPGLVRHWKEIPAAPTTAFKDFDLTCLPSTERATVFYSSGTTAQRPSKHFHSPESLAVYEHSVVSWFRHNVVGFASSLTGPLAAHSNSCLWQLVVLTPPPAESPNSSLVHMFETVRRVLKVEESAFVGTVQDDGGWRIKAERAIELLNRDMHHARPALILGTAFSFVHLLDYIVERNLWLKLPPGSRAMETGGYKGRSRTLPKAELHALISARLGIPAAHIVSEYGMSELSSQAYDTITGTPSRQRLFRFPPWVRTQVVSPETAHELANGETGLLRVFDLANVYSVMAIQTEDMAVRHGDAFELVGRDPRAEPRGCSLREVETHGRA